MIAGIFNTFIYEPLYNGLVFLISVVPFGDIGLAVILLTLIVKFILFPFAHKGTTTQARMKLIEPEIGEIKRRYEKDKQEQAKKVMELYQKHGLNPFSGCLLFLIQIPVIIALYWVFWKGLAGGVIDASQLYSFIPVPENIHFNFLGFIDITGKSYFLAALAGVSQYFQLHLSLPSVDTSQKVSSFKDEFTRNLTFQMRYVFPIFVFFISFSISSAVALYWVTSNAFSIAHEFFVKRKASEITKTA
ncbi:MAG: YidC/Oxa1 family membrane protein insertase [Patescibacteria group bacterium]